MSTNNTNNNNRRRGCRGRAWTTEMVDCLAQLFSTMWRELGYGSNEYQNEETRFQRHRVRFRGLWLMISSNGNCYVSATYPTILRMLPGL